MLSRDWVQALSAIYCSDEQKAIDGAGISQSPVSVHRAPTQPDLKKP